MCECFFIVLFFLILVLVIGGGGDGGDNVWGELVTKPYSCVWFEVINDNHNIDSRLVVVVISVTLSIPIVYYSHEQNTGGGPEK